MDRSRIVFSVRSFDHSFSAFVKSTTSCIQEPVNTWEQTTWKKAFAILKSAPGLRHSHMPTIQVAGRTEQYSFQLQWQWQFSLHILALHGPHRNWIILSFCIPNRNQIKWNEMLDYNNLRTWIWWMKLQLSMVSLFESLPYFFLLNFCYPTFHHFPLCSSQYARFVYSLAIDESRSDNKIEWIELAFHYWKWVKFIYFLTIISISAEYRIK